MGQQVNVYRKLKFFPGATVEGWAPQGEGRTYYVNNMTGSSTADGLSWNSSVDQINAAVVLSEAYRTLGGGRPGDAYNDYIHNTIVVQGTCQITTAYTASNYYDKLTDLPHHTDLIGLGDHFLGMDKGTVIIGAINSAADGITDASTTRGIRMFNLMVGADGTGNSAMHVSNLFRADIEDCWFGQHTNADNDEDINAGIEIDGSMGHCIVRHCIIGQTNGAYYPTYGMDLVLGSGGNNLIEDNVIFGKTSGILMTTTDNWSGTVIRNNVISGMAAECSGTGITSGQYVIIAGNYICAADPVNSGTTGIHVGNWTNDSGTPQWFPKITTT